MHCVYRPDGIGTVLHEERDRFLEIKDRLRRLLEHQLTNFRYIFLAMHMIFGEDLPPHDHNNVTFGYLIT